MQLTDDELRADLSLHRTPLDQVTETTHEWVIGTLTLHKSQRMWRKGYAYSLEGGEAFRTFAFDLDGHRGVGVLFESRRPSPLYFVGWVPLDRATEAESWVTFLNSEIENRLADRPAGPNWTFDPHDGSTAADIEDEIAMERMRHGTRPPLTWIATGGPPPRSPPPPPPPHVIPRVLKDPSSMRARQAQLHVWQTAKDPRAELLELQVELAACKDPYGSTERATAITARVALLVQQHGRAWAGEIADLVTSFVFHRGLVGEVTVSGEQFLALGSRLFELAPVQHVNLTAPLDVEQLAACSLLSKLSSLDVSGHGSAFGDRGAIAFASSTHVTGLRWLGLDGNDITEAGVHAIAASPHLEKLAYLSLHGNPCDATPSVHVTADVRSPHRPIITETLERTHGFRPWMRAMDVDRWPPDRDDLATDHFAP